MPTTGARPCQHPQTPTLTLDDPPTLRLLAHRRLKCIHCQEMFVQDENRRGSCLDAPDPAKICIDRLTCLCCARAVLYHCMRDDTEDPCATCSATGAGAAASSMGGGDEGTSWGVCRRWTVVSMLSVVVPCLWCYWPLMGCHWCAVRGGCCGGRHSDTWCKCVREVDAWRRRLWKIMSYCFQCQVIWFEFILACKLVNYIKAQHWIVIKRI